MSAVRCGTGSSALDQELLTDVFTGNLRPVLAMTDRNAMAHSIEARVPYVDRRIIEFAFRLPDRYKIGAGKRKRILRLLAERYLPKAIVGRVDRIGFGVPIEQWLTTGFRAELAALPDGAVFARSTIVDRSRLRDYIDGFLAGRHHEFRHGMAALCHRRLGAGLRGQRAVSQAVSPGDWEPVFRIGHAQTNNAYHSEGRWRVKVARLLRTSASSICRSSARRRSSPRQRESLEQPEPVGNSCFDPS